MLCGVLRSHSARPYCVVLGRRCVASVASTTLEALSGQGVVCSSLGAQGSAQGYTTQQVSAFCGHCCSVCGPIHTPHMPRCTTCMCTPSLVTAPVLGSPHETCIDQVYSCRQSIKYNLLAVFHTMVVGTVHSEARLRLLSHCSLPCCGASSVSCRDRSSSRRSPPPCRARASTCAAPSTSRPRSRR